MIIHHLPVHNTDWLLTFVPQGGDEIDDIFGCTTVDTDVISRRFAIADTYNVAGGDRQNVGDNTVDVSLYFLICNGYSCIALTISL